MLIYMIVAIFPYQRDLCVNLKFYKYVGCYVNKCNVSDFPFYEGLNENLEPLIMDIGLI